MDPRRKKSGCQEYGLHQACGCAVTAPCGIALQSAGPVHAASEFMFTAPITKQQEGLGVFMLPSPEHLMGRADDLNQGLGGHAWVTGCSHNKRDHEGPSLGTVVAKLCPSRREACARCPIHANIMEYAHASVRQIDDTNRRMRGA